MFGCRPSVASSAWVAAESRLVEAKELLERYAAGERDFARADLHRADLSEANVGGACLFGADLSTANLEGANLEEADCRFLRLASTRLINLDLARYVLPAWLCSARLQPSTTVPFCAQCTLRA